MNRPPTSFSQPGPGHRTQAGHRKCAPRGAPLGTVSSAHLFGMRIQEPGPLDAYEHAAVETRQGEPFGPASCPAEARECGFASLEIRDHLGDPRGS